MKNTFAIIAFSLVGILSMSSLEALAFKDSKIPVSPKVIYGNDDRSDYYQITSEALKDLAPATLAIVYNENISKIKSDEYIIKAKTLKESHDLCSDEIYADQMTASDCTAFLIAPDIAITAGHCMNTVQDCAKKKFVQNYFLSSADSMKNGYVVNEIAITQCVEILAREKNPGTGVDYAVVRLQKVLAVKKYFEMRKTDTIADFSELTVIGYPSGLPLKYTQKSRVRANDKEHFFQMDADTFGGNSGSPVINEDTGLVEGILVRGERDYEYDGVQKCYRTKKCAMGTCRGEDVVRATSVPLENLETTIKTLGLSHNISTLPRTE